MDLTGSIYDATAPLSMTLGGSLAGGPTGSSAIDTILGTLFSLPSLFGSLAAMAGADIGSTWGP
ncbi:hypothetical protein OVA21_02145 [Dietzia sp. SL131]|uniref:hypothetical protein n=1 Tax=Dietzia sp. SL131 TaxID=2995149 RepID=UPI00227B35D7|nr:hypothetical protein [Dietzia sp. SL131]MCY1656042.1 hypothetical protein [Dietzia sp. SL131]